MHALMPAFWPWYIGHDTLQLHPYGYGSCTTETFPAFSAGQHTTARRAMLFILLANPSLASQSAPELAQFQHPDVR